MGQICNFRGCEDCLASVSRCGECAIAIEAGGGKTWEDGLAYCHACSQGVNLCFYCNRPVYGRGLRRCLRLEEQVGAWQLVENMKSLTSFSLWTSLLVR